MAEYLFFSGAALTLAGALLAVIARNLFHAALGLALTLCGTAGLFIPLGGELISVVQILVYLGATAIAIIFILMLSPPFYLKRPQRNVWKIARAFAVALVVIVPLIKAISTVMAPVTIDSSAPTVEDIGRVLLTDFVFPFEIISVLLTVAIIGAIALARDLPSDKDHHTTAEKLEEGRS